MRETTSPGAGLQLLYGIGAVGLAALLALAVVVASASGAVDFCYVSYFDLPLSDYDYRIIGHRAWRADVTVAQVTSTEEAAQAMKTLCPAPPAEGAP